MGETGLILHFGRASTALHLGKGVGIFDSLKMDWRYTCCVFYSVFANRFISNFRKFIDSLVHCSTLPSTAFPCIVTFLGGFSGITCES